MKDTRTLEFCCTHDLIFKALFTYQPRQGQPLIRSLLQAILQQSPYSVDITQTDLIQEGLSSKDIRMDLCARVDGERIVNIAMQMASSLMEIRNRSAYYACSLLTRQENKGSSYRKLVPVNQVFLLNFSFSEGGEGVHEYTFYDVKGKESLTEVVKIHIIEIKKITQMSKFEVEKSLLEKWCWFLSEYRESGNSAELEAMMEKEEVFQEARKIMMAMSEDQRMRDILFERNRQAMDLAQMKLESEERGEQEAIRANVKRMLEDSVSDELILRYTGLDKSQLNQLKREIKESSMIKASES